jgi:hypothetical protein
MSAINLAIGGGTNNTGKIIGIGQALMWLWDVDEVVDTPAAMMFDSCHAVNVVTGRWQPNANIALLKWARRLMVDVEATGRTVHGCTSKATRPTVATNVWTSYT